MALKKPKKLKYPKKPKASASAKVLENFLRKVKEIDRRNKEALSSYTREKSRRETLLKQIARL